MIFVIDESVFFRRADLSDEEKEKIEILLISAAKGNAFVVFSREGWEWLSGVDWLGLTGKKYINRKLASFSYQKAFFDVCRNKVFIHKDGAVDDGGCFVELKRIETSFFEACRLICEDLSDAFIYEVAAKHAALERGLSNPDDHVGFDFINGGGDRTGKSAEESIASGRSFVCVVDSDVKFPGGGSGETAKKVFKIKGGFPSPFFKRIKTHGRYVESYIPEGVASGFTGVSGNFIRVFSFLRKNHFASAFIYCPVKTGMSYKKMLRYSSSFKDYWSPLYLILQDYGADVPCMNFHDCNERQCQCYVVPGSGCNLAEQFLKYLSSKTLKETYDAMKFSEGWLDIGGELFDSFFVDARVTV